MRWVASAAVTGAMMGGFALCQAGVARAATPTITAATITTPANPTYLYDSTGGAYGGFTVSGTVSGTAVSAAKVDIDCYDGAGSSGADKYTIDAGVTVRANGTFSAHVPYSAMEAPYYELMYSPDGADRGVCHLRAVPAGTQPTSGLQRFSGPDVALSLLAREYDQAGTSVDDDIIVAAQSGATNIYTAFGDCGLESGVLTDPADFGDAASRTFACNDAIGVYPGSSQMLVDGKLAFGPTLAFSATPVGPFRISATQNAGNGDLTIHESEPLYLCSQTYNEGTATYCEGSYSAAGVAIDRTIQQIQGGRAVLITDTWVSTDKRRHTLSMGLENQQCFGCLEGTFDTTAVSYRFPGHSSYSTYSSGATVTPARAVPQTIFIEDNTEPNGSADGSQGAITLFRVPSGAYSFVDAGADPNDEYEALFNVPYTLTVPATGTSARIGFADTQEFNRAALTADIAAATKLYQADGTTTKGTK